MSVTIGGIAHSTLDSSTRLFTVKEYARLLYRPSGDHTNKALGIQNGFNRETIEPFNSFIYKTKKKWR